MNATWKRGHQCAVSKVHSYRYSLPHRTGARRPDKTSARRASACACVGGRVREKQCAFIAACCWPSGRTLHRGGGGPAKGLLFLSPQKSEPMSDGKDDCSESKMRYQGKRDEQLLSLFRIDRSLSSSLGRAISKLKLMCRREGRVGLQIAKVHAVQ